MPDHPSPEQASLHRALAFGDSVMWGQGLLHHDKFATRIAREVYDLDLPQNAIIAHSGAIIDTDDGAVRIDVPDGESAPVYGEIPRSHPSIFRQVLTYGLPLPFNQVARRDLPEMVFPDVRLVLVNGGINDIDASEIVSGHVGTFAELERRVDEVCRQRFLTLLRTVRARFPSAEIVTPGYHFVFSQDSLKEIVEIADLFFAEGDELADQIRRAIRQSSWFMGLGAAAHYRAIDAFNAEDLRSGGPGAYYVPSLQGPEHAAFASESLSWQIERHRAGERLRRFFVGLLTKDWSELIGYHSADPARQIREGYCEAYAVDVRGGIGVDEQADATCQLAGLFHPDDHFADRATTLAGEVRARFATPASFRERLGGGESSLRRFAAASALPRPTSWRQLFATEFVGSIRLDGIIEHGTDGEFPYHVLWIEFEVNDGADTFTYRLNDLLPFIAGFADRNDDLFPGAYGEVRRSRSGNFSTVENIEEDTPFTFFAYPTDRFSLLDVTGVRIRAEDVGADLILRLKDPRLEVNGRALGLIPGTLIVRTGEPTDLMF